MTIRIRGNGQFCASETVPIVQAHTRKLEIPVFLNTVLTPNRTLVTHYSFNRTFGLRRFFPGLFPCTCAEDWPLTSIAPKNAYQNAKDTKNWPFQSYRIYTTKKKPSTRFDRFPFGFFAQPFFCIESVLYSPCYSFYTDVCAVYMLMMRMRTVSNVNFEPLSWECVFYVIDHYKKGFKGFGYKGNV